MGCRLKEVLRPAIFYSFSFSRNRGWTTVNPSGLGITEYLAAVCAEYQIVDKIQLNTDVRQFQWLEDAEEWEVTLVHLAGGTGDLSERDRHAKADAEGERSVYLATEVRAKIVVSAVGGLIEPKVRPTGIDAFEGEFIHTAQWKPNVDLRGKDIIVIGTGCSAAQVVPELIKPPYNAKSVTQLMRSPRVIPEILSPEQLKKWAPYSPILMRNYARKHRPIVEEHYLRYMRAQVPEKYHEILTPDYRVGCKRRILDSGWLRSLQEPNIELIMSRLQSVQSKSVTLGPGRNYPSIMSRDDSEVPTDEVTLPADVIILATGYETNQWLLPLRVPGKGEKDLHDLWGERGGPQAYLGVAMDKFPNFFHDHWTQHDHRTF
ncbi:hypothetical protein Egran_00548 [Elaphomyces granulatus]|uniref:L-ornithine N(5)-monooxygenase n=1 Tax=Elaphomyces granulatus TaxID=519963 RepID=A0A232M5I3_9EURO|nr:hypothetical protein Egran_00548 [Elaphomyces granulatus]